MATVFCVIGSGAWGTAAALLLRRKPGQQVRLWTRSSGRCAEMRSRRENAPLLAGVPIPDDILITDDFAAAADGAAAWVVAVPTVYLRDTLSGLRPRVPPGTRIVSLVKGVERETFRRPSEIQRELFGPVPIAVLGGPSHAEEVARGLPASVVVAAEDAEHAAWWQAAFGHERFRVYTQTDVIGVELAGALKNVIGIAAGICDGLELGDNAKAALLTRGLVEMTRFGTAFGADPATFAGLAGLGDLITTCMSRHGRNRSVGEQLARGRTLPEILRSTAAVPEGVYTAQSVHERVKATALELPIINAVHDVLYQNKPPRKAAAELMLRPPVPE